MGLCGSKPQDGADANGSEAKYASDAPERIAVKPSGEEDGENGAGQSGDESAENLGALGKHSLSVPVRASDGKTLVLVLGGPGSGKGTQCALLKATFGFSHLSTGELLRAEVASGSDLGNMVKARMESGELVDTGMVLQLLVAAMERDGGRRFLVDGFPRTLDQALLLERAVGAPSFVVAFDAPEKVLEERLLERGVSSGRSDDTLETIQKRFKTFLDQSKPAIDLYASMGMVETVDAVGSVEDVKETVVEVFSKAEGEIERNDERKRVVQPPKEVVFVLGAPGSGKGTQCERIAKEFNFHHLSTGDMLRDEVATGSPIGIAVKQVMDAGQLVSSEQVMQVIASQFQNLPETTTKILLDGFPRALDQCFLYERTLGAPAFVLAFTAPEEELERRLVSRGQASGRSDDNVETIRKRFRTFAQQSQPAIDLYTSIGAVETIDANDTPDNVYQRVQTAFQNRGFPAKPPTDTSPPPTESSKAEEQEEPAPSDAAPEETDEKVADSTVQPENASESVPQASEPGEEAEKAPEGDEKQSDEA